MAINYRSTWHRAPRWDEQIEQIGDLLERKPEEGNVGDKWAVLPGKWLKDWKTYTNYSPPGVDNPVARDVFAQAPGKINIDNIKKGGDVWGDSDAIIDLRAELDIGNAVEVVPKEAFDLFEDWYGMYFSTKGIIREITEIDGRRDVELYPFTFSLCTCGHDGEPREKAEKHVSRGMTVSDLIDMGIKDLSKEDEGYDTETALCKVWFGNDKNLWYCLGTGGAKKELTKDVAEFVRGLPKAESSTRLMLMVEDQRDGQWRRSEVNRVEVLAAIKAKQVAVNAMSDEEWRASLQVDDLLDHLDQGEGIQDAESEWKMKEEAAKADAKENAKQDDKKDDKEDGADDKEKEETEEEPEEKWREARVRAVNADGTIVVGWRGVPRHSVTLPRESELISKPFSKIRDWRNQLREKRKVEISINALALSDGKKPDEVAPIYRKGSVYLYYIPAKNEWWIGDWMRQRHGYMWNNMSTAEGKAGDKSLLDPLKIPPSGGWTYWEQREMLDQWRVKRTIGNWKEMEVPINIAVHTPGANEGDYPESIEISGHDGYQKDKMGIWWRTNWLQSEVTKIDRTQGKVSVELKQQVSRAEATDIIKGIDLYGEQIVQMGTHLVPKKEKGRSSLTSREGNGTQGSVGLNNIGNTCYMNSILQCMNASKPLRDLFGDPKKLKDQINLQNPIGSGGAVAEAYSDLVQEMWSGSKAVVNPSRFKETLGEFVHMAVGYAQHDAMELYGNLMDQLHEDVNRIIDKPYLEGVDDEGQPDDELAEESWKRHKLRNDSHIVDYFSGQFRSHLTCPECKHESRKFDPFNAVPLPVPSSGTQKLEITTVLADVTKAAITVKISAKGNARNLVDALITELAKAGVEVTPATLILVEIYQNKVYKTLYSPCFTSSDCTDINKIREHDILFAYEVPQQEMKEPEPVEPEPATTRYHSYSHSHTQLSLGDDFKGMLMSVRQGRRSDFTDTIKELGPQRITFPFTEDMTCKEIHHMLWDWAKLKLPKVDPESSVYRQHTPTEPLAVEAGADKEGADDDDQLKKSLSCEPIVIEKKADRAALEAVAEGDPPIMPKYIVHIMEDNRPLRVGASWERNAPYRALPYSDTKFSDVLDRVVKKRNKPGIMLTFDEDEDIESLIKTGPPPGGDPGGLTLHKCFQTFSAGEKLNQLNAWRCTNCKQEVQAHKKMDIWMAPPILVLQLKRFLVDPLRPGYREKIDDDVSFTEHLDLSQYVLGPQKDEDLEYELCGVTEHMGGVGGGHYIAYCKVNGKWSQYNDSTVTPCSIEKACVPGAYALFYRRLSKEEIEERKQENGGGDQ
mmetsp:Transcript_18225/g.47568  ORF Transcript_18225/g.47568 Transcript_18225/m.47568 type:complete len:1305 (-) Transcript_18225:193-4107(-)|eukprot:CAMPEP_0182915966 /NCGR_PEP_ID=MMETSP0105_2-20130417/654_1 /TAXON_ID=81532 ORGANISM="Acanthoeca-like sp., Strain 10tr" /NCGR_SAMPLE_ID=MMETSP0105_2 /ASSEMBLY_ACC=CAM_ASM_000205 /LENGTH=1304 /DNA_ID=CAMNT_0025052877 /DNA_START=148 /DNA_END=4062 /DNA_ORIENTATION=+